MTTSEESDALAEAWQGDGELVQPGILEPPSLLPGEMLDSQLLDDVAHWVAVYEELTSVVRQFRPDAPEVLDRYGARLRYWRDRRDQMEHDGD